MKSYKVKFIHGQFIEEETQKRIIPIQGKSYIIISEEDSFDETDPRMKVNEILDSEKKKISIEKKYGINRTIKLLNKGEKLFYRIGNSKRIQGDESQSYIFLSILLEDLYIHLKKDKKGDNINDWQLVNSVIRLENCISSDIKIVEKIQADSLNQLYSKTVTFYFNMQRSASANAFTSFYLYKPNLSIVYQPGFNNDNNAFHNFQNLQDLRIKNVKKFIDLGYKSPE